MKQPKLLPMIALLCFALSVAAYLWTDQALMSSTIENMQLKADQKGIATEAKDIALLLKQRKQLPSNVDKVNKSSTLTFIERHAKKSGLGRIKADSRRTLVDKKQNIHEMSISISPSREVSLENAVKFMYNLEQGGFGLRVNSLLLTASKKAKGKWKFQCRVSSLLRE